MAKAKKATKKTSTKQSTPEKNLSKIQNLLQHEEYEYFQQGLTLLESLGDSYAAISTIIGTYTSTPLIALVMRIGDFFQQEASNWYRPLEDELHQNLSIQKEFEHKFLLWLFAHCAQFPETKSVVDAYSTLILQPHGGWYHKSLPNPDNLQLLTAVTKVIIVTHDWKKSWGPQRLNQFCDFVFTIPNLKELQILGVEFKEFPSTFENAQHLESLHIEKCALQTIPNSIASLTKLHTLILSHNNITAVPTALTKLRELEVLHLNENSLSNLPAKFHAVKELNIVGNDVNTIPNGIEHLIISWENLEKVNSTIAKRKTLQKISIREKASWNGPSLNAIAKVVNNNDKIVEITVPKANPDHEEDVIEFNVPNLEILQIRWSAITHLPKGLENSHNLQVLDFSLSRLKELPSTIGNFSNLKELYLSNSSWGNDGFNSIPEEIGNCKKLQRINLSGHSVTSLPDSICELSDLISLNLSKNALTSLPSNLGNCAELESITLFQNKLRDIPESLQKCTHLRYLDVSQNGINTLPEWLLDMNLEKAKWQFNRLQNYPNAVIPSHPNVYLWAGIEVNGSKYYIDHNRSPLKELGYGTHRIGWGEDRKKWRRRWSGSPTNWYDWDMYHWEKSRKVEKQLKTISAKLFPVPEQSEHLSWGELYRKYYVFKNDGPTDDFLGSLPSPNPWSEETWESKGYKNEVLPAPSEWIQQKIDSGKTLNTKDLLRYVRDQITHEYGSKRIPFSKSLIKRITSIILEDLPSLCLKEGNVGKVRIIFRNFGTFSSYTSKEKSVFKINQYQPSWEEYPDEVDTTNQLKVSAKNCLRLRLSSAFQSPEIDPLAQLMFLRVYERQWGLLNKNYETSLPQGKSDIALLLYEYLRIAGYKYHRNTEISVAFIKVIFEMLLSPTKGLLACYLAEHEDWSIRIKGFFELHQRYCNINARISPTQKINID